MENGRILPCGGHHTDPDACGAALFNAPRLAKISLGMTKDDVLKIMEHPAERREAKTSDGHDYESWLYMVNYTNEQMTAITFTDGKVTAMNTVPWKNN